MPEVMVPKATLAPCLSVVKMSAFRSMSSSTEASSPRRAAFSSAELPLASTVSTAAPAACNRRTSDVLPVLAAKKRGEAPPPVDWPRSMPRSRSSSMIASCPLQMARLSSVCPLARTLILAPASNSMPVNTQVLCLGRQHRRANAAHGRACVAL